jgi:hypothetical protein
METQMSGGRVVNIKMIFYSNIWWESECPGRLTDSSGTDSMLRLWLERGGDGRKCCQKMYRSQRARLGSMEESVTRRDTVVMSAGPGERRHHGGEMKETTPVGLTRILLDLWSIQLL